MIHSVMGHYLGFGLSDGLHIAYLDSTRCRQQFGYNIAHAGSFKSCKNAFLNDPKCQKGGFWPFSWVWSVGSSWHCILC